MCLSRNLLALLAALAALFCLAGTAGADGFIIIDPIRPIPRPMPPQPAPFSLSVKYHHVDVTVTNGVAVTSIDQVFHNDNPRDLEGTYIFPLPEDAAVSNFTMWADSKPMEGKVLPKDEARRIYESYVRRRIDPALLEYIGRDMFQARVFPIPANGDKRIQLKYSQVVPFDAGVYSYRYPLDTERFSSKPLDDVSLRVKIDSQKPLKAIYSPTHEIEVHRHGDTQASVSFEAKNVRPSKDFRLYYSVSDKEFGLNLLTFSPDDKKEDGGFFLMMLAPRTETDAAHRPPKDITFVLDTSGSMSGEKIKQAKRALRFALEHLNSGDRFALMTFSGEVEKFRPDLVAATPENIADAAKFVDDIVALGGTNINDALDEALKIQHPRAGSPAMVVFLTDGLPTIGVTDVPQILKNVDKEDAGQTRIFTFGVGDDVNTHLLDLISGKHGGVSEYVRPGEDLEVKVSSFYTKVATPALSNVSVDYGGMEVYDVYPKHLPDLFAGSQLLVLGRFRHSGRATVSLNGSVSGETRRFTYSADFAGEDKSAEFLPRLWATRKVATLLDEIRLNGTNQELVDEVTRLGTRYGIVTPYTSSLVEEDMPQGPGGPVFADGHVAGRPGGFGGRGGAASAERRRLESLSAALPGAGAGAPGAPAVTGGQAVDAAKALREDKEAARARDDFGGLRHVEGKAFRLVNGVWTDTEYKPEMKKREMPFASDQYFALLKQEPKLAKVLALGEQVIVVWKGEAIVVTAPKEEAPKAGGVTVGPGAGPASGPGSSWPAGGATAVALALAGALALLRRRQGALRLAGASI